MDVLRRSLLKICRHNERQLSGAQIRELVDAGADVNITDNEGETALFYAVRQGGNESVVRALIDAGADVNITDNEGETALFYAVQLWYDESVVRALIEAGADVNITDNEGKTALFHAVQQWDNESVVRALIEAGADVNITYNEGKTALIYAVQRSGNENVVRTLIEAGADVNIIYNGGKTALFYAVRQWDNESVVLALIGAGADVNITDNDGNTALFYTVQHSYKESVVRALIDAGADVNITYNEGKTALVYAVQQRNNESVVGALIDAGADVNITDNERKTALFYAVQQWENESVVGALIDAGADLNVKYSEEQTILFKVLASKSTTQVLFDEGNPQVDARDVYGRTPLFYAMVKSLETARLLIDKGANLEVKDNANVSILSFFIEKFLMGGYNSSKGLQLFKQKGVKKKEIFQTLINAVLCTSLRLLRLKSLSDVLETAKHYMKIYDKKQRIIKRILSIIRQNDENVVLYILDPLVELGANPNNVDSYGNTALHYAIRLVFENVPQETIMAICLKLKNVGKPLLFNIKNLQNETPVLFGLTEKFLHDLKKENTNWVSLLTDVYRFLLENGSSVDDIEKGGNSVFHLILILFQRFLDCEMETKKKVLVVVTDLFQLCCQASTTIRVTMNRRDAHLNSPLHLWASLKWIGLSQDEWKHMQALLKQILKYGGKLNDANENDETPLHLCTTWRAAELLLDEGANPLAVDSTGRTPLLSAAMRYKDKIKNPNLNLEAFYEDVSESPDASWKTLFKANLDPWSADKHGESVFGILIEVEGFVLAKSFLEAAREMKFLESDTIIAPLLNVICEDKSIRTLWKSNLIEIILQSRKDHSTPLQCNGETPLHSCCRNIMNLGSSNDGAKPQNNYHQSTLDKKESVSRSRSNKEDAVVDLTKSVHWTIAKLLLSYGADCTIRDVTRQSCLDIAEACPALKDLLSSPVNIDEVPLLIPWTIVSERYQPVLAKVARRQECVNVQQYWFHNEYLASGSFGVVFAGINEKDGREVAIKRIEKRHMQRPEDKREITNLTALANCEQVVLYLSFFEDHNYCYVVLELMEGNLDEYLESSFEVKESIKLCQDVVQGLNFLYSLKPQILHRDVKPANILYKRHPKLCLKIADFGLSRRTDCTSTSVYGTNAGTRCWIAPEVLTSTKDQHSTASDMFSCGLVLHYILSVKKHPFSPANCSNKGELQICNETEGNVIKSKMEGWDYSLGSEGFHLIKKLLDGEARMRPTAGMSLAHPLFWSNVKKMDFLIAAGNQPEFGCPRVKRTLPLTAVENDLEASFGITVKYVDWNDPGYVRMPAIYTEMTTKRKSYDTHSVVELVRFIRNAYAHVTELSLPNLLLEDFVFLEYFPNLVMEVYKAVTSHGWDQTRDEIKYALDK